jgi:hypothetical protein
MSNMRQFFITYSHCSIQQKPSAELQNTEVKKDVIWQKPSAISSNYALNWSHYLVLIRIENEGGLKDE